jgi:mutator protein MutT
MHDNRAPDPAARVVEVGIGIVVRESPDKSQKQGKNHEILVTRRKPDTVFGGYWELPGGKADPGEPIDACVVRELLEEVGVLARVTGALPDVEHVYPHAHVRLHPRLCALAPGSPEPSALHVAAWAWCPLERLHEYRFPPANNAIISALRERLNDQEPRA